MSGTFRLVISLLIKINGVQISISNLKMKTCLSPKVSMTENLSMTIEIIQNIAMMQKGVRFLH